MLKLFSAVFFVISGHFLETFASNPQILVDLNSPDNNDNDGLCTIIVGVLQMYRRELRSEGLDMLPIGFAIYQVINVQGQ